jgi:hypothetical protein
MLKIIWLLILYLVMYKLMSHKLIHIFKKRFFFVGAICNLAIEFNGLVSSRVSRDADPFTFIDFLFLFFYIFLINKIQFFFFSIFAFTFTS